MEQNNKERKLNAYRESHQRDLLYISEELKTMATKNEITVKSLDKLEKLIDTLTQIWRNQNMTYINLVKSVKEFRDEGVLGEKPS